MYLYSFHQSGVHFPNELQMFDLRCSIQHNLQNMIKCSLSAMYYGLTHSLFCSPRISLTFSLSIHPNLLAQSLCRSYIMLGIYWAFILILTGRTYKENSFWFPLHQILHKCWCNHMQKHNTQNRKQLSDLLTAYLLKQVASARGHTWFFYI